MNHVSLPLNPHPMANDTHRGRLAWAVGLVLCLLASSGLWAIGGNKQCYTCRLHGDIWDCDTIGEGAGAGCILSPSSCTIVGSCLYESHTPFITLGVSLELVDEVAGADSGAAATLVRLRQMQALPETIQVGWLSTDISPQDVASLAAGGDLVSKTPGQASRFDVRVVLLDGGDAALIMQPSADSDVQDFNELAIFLERDSDSGVHHAKTWFLH